MFAHITLGFDMISKFASIVQCIILSKDLEVYIPPARALV